MDIKNEALCRIFHISTELKSLGKKEQDERLNALSLEYNQYVPDSWMKELDEIGLHKNIKGNEDFKPYSYLKALLFPVFVSLSIGTDNEFTYGRNNIDVPKNYPGHFVAALINITFYLIRPDDKPKGLFSISRAPSVYKNVDVVGNINKALTLLKDVDALINESDWFPNPIRKESERILKSTKFLRDKMHLLAGQYHYLAMAQFAFGVLVKILYMLGEKEPTKKVKQIVDALLKDLKSSKRFKMASNANQWYENLKQEKEKYINYGFKKSPVYHPSIDARNFLFNCAVTFNSETSKDKGDYRFFSDSKDSTNCLINSSMTFEAESVPQEVWKRVYRSSDK